MPRSKFIPPDAASEQVGRAFLKWTHPPTLFAGKNMNNLFRSLPSVDACLSGLENAAPTLYATTPRPLLRSLTNAFLDGCRRDIKEDEYKRQFPLFLLRKPKNA